MKKRLLTTALLVAAIAPTYASAQGRPNCGSRDVIVSRLQDHYGEQRTGAGLTPNNGMLEVFSSAENGTWTILMTMPTGQSCLVAAGESWQDAPPELTKSGAPV